MPEYTLYAYYRSSCSARLRILLELKKIPYDHIPINLLQDEQLSPHHRSLNPSASVPLLICHSTGLKISQSLAALEFIEETHPSPSAFPPASEPDKRALVRTLCAIIACDTQPVTNLRIMRRVRGLGGNAEEWNKDLMTDGLRAYEAVVGQVAGEYSVGNQVTLADACLVPAVWNAERFGVDVAQFATVARVARNLAELDAVREAEYFRQSDCPPDLKVDGQ